MASGWDRGRWKCIVPRHYPRGDRSIAAVMAGFAMTHRGADAALGYALTVAAHAVAVPQGIRTNPLAWILGSINLDQLLLAGLPMEEPIHAPSIQFDRVPVVA